MTIGFFYFSGTGNVEYYVDYILDRNKIRAVCTKNDISKGEDLQSALINSDVVVLAYPTIAGAYSVIIKEFIERYENCFLDKDIAIISASVLTSGDSIAPLAKKLRGYGASVRWARRLNKPQDISDRRFSRIKPKEVNERLLKSELPKLDEFMNCILSDTESVKINPFSRLLGFIERLYYLPRESKMKQGIRINLAECNYCLECIEMCPSENLFVCNSKVSAGDRCAACYRCVNGCKRHAISLYSKHKPEKSFERIIYNSDK